MRHGICGYGHRRRHDRSWFPHAYVASRAPVTAPDSEQLGSAAALAHGFCEILQNRKRRVPGDAAVGHALAKGHPAALADLLATADQEAFDHDAEDGAAAARYLRRDGGRDLRLFVGLFAAVGVAGVDHQLAG